MAWWVLVGCVVVILGVLVLWRERVRWMASGGASECHYFSTRDGWEVALHRYAAKRRRSAIPVLLFHGMGSNERVWSLTGESSWVAQLNQAGYDVWVCSWRGEGRSRPRFGEVRHAWGWPVQAWLEEDLPALWAGVLRVTGSTKVHCVGHGLGGRLLLEALRLRTHPTVLTCTLLGVGKAPRIAASRWFGRIERLLVWPRFPWPGIAVCLRVILWGVCRLRGWKLGFSETRAPNLAVMRRWLMVGTEPISGPLLRQWLLWQGRTRGYLGEIEELGNDSGAANARKQGDLEGKASLAEREAALMSVSPQETTGAYASASAYEGKGAAHWLFVVGDRDMIAPLEAVERLLREVGEGHKQVICLPLQDSVHAMHYSHLDLLISPALRDDFFPLWLRWLEDPKGVSFQRQGLFEGMV